MTTTKAKEVAGKARAWLKDQVVQEVPDALALCEFGCHKSQCRMGKWANCERRLRNVKDLQDWRAANP